jgi:hypothetical protein
MLPEHNTIYKPNKTACTQNHGKLFATQNFSSVLLESSHSPVRALKLRLWSQLTSCFLQVGWLISFSMTSENLRSGSSV